MQRRVGLHILVLMQLHPEAMQLQRLNILLSRAAQAAAKTRVAAAARADSAQQLAFLSLLGQP
jgi:hypothetical protein